MFYFILGAFFGALVMFAARLADKDITRIVERYKESGSLVGKKPIIIDPTKDNQTEDLIKEIMES